MKLGLISDAHGNPMALRNCIRVLERRRVDEVYFLGDAVGYMPGVSEVLAILQSSGAKCQKGNHEAMLLGEIPLREDKDLVYKIRSARERISKEDLEFIRSWPDHRSIMVDDRSLLLVHGSPEDYLNGYVYSQEDLQLESLRAHDAVFMGHTHYPFVADFHGHQVVNTGSCGLPRDQGDLSSFAIYDSSAHHTTILRLLFNSRAVIEYYGKDEIAPEVVECLHRRSPDVFGVMAEQDAS
ncbi:MAG: metallophosphoesterase family protein [Anaerolineales bacterium]|jgi:putative phosphoesterase